MQQEATGFPLGSRSLTPSPCSSIQHVCHSANRSTHLVVVFVAAPALYLALAPPGLSAAIEETVQQLTAEMRRQVSQRAEELALPITFLCRRGAAAVELARVADELRADMVVVGATRHRGHRLTGSVARRLVRTARWPVVVVP